MTIRKSALLALTAPLALALTACGDGGGDVPEGEAIAHIAAPDGQEWMGTAATTELGGVVVGNPDAPIKLVEYASHTCGACANFSTASTPKLETYIESGVVSYEIRNQVHNVVDLTLAVMMRCNGPDAFQPLSHQVWSNLNAVMNRAQADSEALNAATSAPEEVRYQRIAEATGLLDFFAARGLARDQAMQCLAGSETALGILERSRTQSDELNVTGTPTFFINDRNVGTQSWDSLEPMLQTAGAR